MSTITQRIKHDQYLDTLCERIAPYYDRLLVNVPVLSKKRQLAEIDVLAFKGDACDVYEVKCSYRIVKARKQLKRIRRLISARQEVRNLFFFCGESGLMVAV